MNQISELDSARKRPQRGHNAFCLKPILYRNFVTMTIFPPGWKFLPSPVFQPSCIRSQSLEPYRDASFGAAFGKRIALVTMASTFILGGPGMNKKRLQCKKY